MTNLNELLPIVSNNVNDTEVNTVNSRDIHAYLGVGKKYATWITDAIKSYGFVENTDYVIVQNLRIPELGSSKARPQLANDYYVTLDVAKEICMVSKTDKGRQARRYFIECEKRLLAQPQHRLPQTYLEALECLVETHKQLEAQQPKVGFYDAVTQTEDTLDMAQVAKVINQPDLGRNKLLKALRDRDMLRHNNEPYQRFVDQGLFRLVETNTINGVKVKTVATQKGVDYILKLLEVI